MVSKLEKFLAKLNQNEKRKLDKLIDALILDWKNAGDIKPLKGYINIYRLKSARFRIIFEVVDGNEVYVHKIGFRDDRFYKQI